MKLTETGHIFQWRRAELTGWPVQEGRVVRMHSVRQADRPRRGIGLTLGKSAIGKVITSKATGTGLDPELSCSCCWRREAVVYSSMLVPIVRGLLLWLTDGEACVTAALTDSVPK